MPDQRDPRHDERQHAGGGSCRGHSRGRQDAARRQCETLLQGSLAFHHPVHRLDQVVGGQAEHDRQDHERCGRDRQAEEAGDPGGPQRAEGGNQDGEQHRGAQGEEGDDQDRDQCQRHEQHERGQDGICHRERERR